MWGGGKKWANNEQFKYTWTNTGGSSFAIKLAVSTTQALNRCLTSTDVYILSNGIP